MKNAKFSWVKWCDFRLRALWLLCSCVHVWARGFREGAGRRTRRAGWAEWRRRQRTFQMRAAAAPMAPVPRMPTVLRQSSRPMRPLSVKLPCPPRPLHRAHHMTGQGSP